MPKANTPKLNDVQLVILSSASQRNDGLAVPPENVPTAPLNKALAKLTALGFLKEVRVKRDQPLWRTDEEGKSPASRSLRPARRRSASRRAEPESRSPCPHRSQHAGTRRRPTSATRL